MNKGYPEVSGNAAADFAQKVDQLRSYNSLTANLKLGARAPSPAFSAKRVQSIETEDNVVENDGATQTSSQVRLEFIRASREMRARESAFPSIERPSTLVGQGWYSAKRGRGNLIGVHGSGLQDLGRQCYRLLSNKFWPRAAVKVLWRAQRFRAKIIRERMN